MALKEEFLLKLREYIAQNSFVLEDRFGNSWVYRPYCVSKGEETDVHCVSYGFMPQLSSSLFRLVRIKSSEKTFSEKTLELIEQKGMEEVSVYKKCGLDRRIFSRIRNEKEYQPSKRTALVLAIVLELELEQTEEFLARAGYALSPCLLEDVIIKMLIKEGIYEPADIDDGLLIFGARPLFSGA